ncbi:MAG: DUF2207 domain-containing protein [Patescibacteria group bacterium]|nr:DUF2207 domain-containing protein [Patescibacteria group bacterium]
MKKLLLFLISLSFFLFIPQASFAEVIHNFDTNITAHKNGNLDVTETINYDFENVFKHGIYRYIPLYSKVGDLYRILNIKDVRVERDGINENFTFNKNNEQVYLKIGNADKTITGPHIYKISYTVENGIGSNFSDHDEIYWNATGNSWQITIEKASAKVETDFSAKQSSFICFQGSVGEKDTGCKVSKNSAESSRILSSGEGLTIVAVYPAGTFPKSILSKTPPETLGQKAFALILKNYLYILIFLNILIPLYLFYWYQKHKNKKRFGPPAVNFDIPKDEKGVVLRPALAGTIDTSKLERDDITATIFDLAIRKYIKLAQTKVVKKMAPDKTEQTITKLKGDDGELEGFEKILFDRLFETGDSIKISDLRLDFYKTFQDMEKEVFKTLVDKKYYTKNPKIQKTVLVVLSFIAFFTFNIILGFALFFLSRKLNGRTALGDEIDFKIDGLKLFLKSMDRNYKWQAEKFYTVEQMIPYAMALGYIDKFMEALKILKPDYNPSWYGGGNFYTNYAIFYAASSTNFTTSAPSSSSGSSGGFSGGGGGGGGGGSW